MAVSHFDFICKEQNHTSNDEKQWPPLHQRMQQRKMLLQGNGPEFRKQQCRSAGCCQDGRSDYIFGPKLFMMSCHIVPPFVLFSCKTSDVRPVLPQVFGGRR